MVLVSDPVSYKYKNKISIQSIQFLYLKICKSLDNFFIYFTIICFWFFASFVSHFGICHIISKFYLDMHASFKDNIFKLFIFFYQVTLFNIFILPLSPDLIFRNFYYCFGNHYLVKFVQFLSIQSNIRSFLIHQLDLL